MFLRQLICLLVIVICLNYGAAKVVKKPMKQRDVSSSKHPLVGTAFDYDYFAPESRRAPSRYQQKSNPTTTQRPFIRYWNNFIRNIRVPVPTISWNMTNPLANLFNTGITNVIDTPVGNYNHRSTKRKRSKNTRKHTDTKAKHSKKRKHTHAYEDDAETYQVVAYNDFGEPYPLELDPHKVVYYYDASTGQYYKMQTQYEDSYTQPEQQQQQQLIDVEEEQGEQIAEPEEHEEPEAYAKPEAAQIEPPTMEAAVEGNETESEETPQAVEEEALIDGEGVSGEVDVIPADVENFDDSEEAQTPVKQPVESTKMSKPKNIKTVEELRNAIRAYMLDDHFNRMRQQANTAERYKTLRTRVKPQSKQKFTHYILQPV